MINDYINNYIIKGKSRNYWDNAANRRSFFDEYAMDVGFDPRDAKAWNVVHNKDIIAVKVCYNYGWFFASSFVFCFLFVFYSFKIIIF
jgi:hypothetical protein